jgi:hypothetical protein
LKDDIKRNQGVPVQEEYPCHVSSCGKPRKHRKKQPELTDIKTPGKKKEKALRTMAES